MEKGRKEKKGKVRDVGMETRTPTDFCIFHLFPPLPSWDCLLWSCPGARSRINILAIQAASCQQALPFEQCASSGWTLNWWWPWKQRSCLCFKVHSHKLKLGMPHYSWQTRWSEEVSKCWELQIPKSPFVGSCNNAQEADVVARKGFEAPTRRELEAMPCNKHQGWVGTWEQDQTVLRSLYSGSHGIPRGI